VEKGGCTNGSTAVNPTRGKPGKGGEVEILVGEEKKGSSKSRKEGMRSASPTEKKGRGPDHVTMVS